MAALAEVNALRDTLDDINVLATRDLAELVRQVTDGLSLSPREVSDTLVELLPQLAYPYAATIVELATDFYMADRSAAGVKSPYRPEAAPLPEDRRMAALAGYGASVLYEDPANVTKMLDVMSGGMQRALFDVERDTIWELGSQDEVPVNYQRMTTSAEPCDFCRMLASRGAVYSDKSSTSVVGRGVPTVIYANGKRNRGKGIKARGKGPKRRDLGEDYHDNDKCIGVAVFPGRAQQMEAKALENFELYAEARGYVSDERPRDLYWDQTKSADGSLKRKYRWQDRATGEVVTSKDQTNRIVDAMRKIRTGELEVE